MITIFAERETDADGEGSAAAGAGAFCEVCIVGVDAEVVAIVYAW